jgi:hypothetical protein
MRPPPSPWSLQWSGNGELSPLDRQDLFLFLCLPGINPLRAQTGGDEPGEGRTPRTGDEIESFPYR